MQLSFQNFDKDLELWVNEYERLHLSPGEKLRGPARRNANAQAMESVLKAYLENESYDSLISCILNWYRIDEFIEPLTETLLQKRDLPRLSRLWHGLIAWYK